MVKNITFKKAATAAFICSLAVGSICVSGPKALNAAGKVKTADTQSVNIIKGQKRTLKASKLKGKVKWKSSKKKVVKVSKKGKITAKKKGTAVITAKAGKQQVKFKVKVCVPKISKKTASVKAGKTLTLKLTGISEKVAWSSSKKSVATVTDKGVVTGVKAGKAVITAKVLGKKYKCKVTVTGKAPKNTDTGASEKTPAAGKVEVTGVSLNKSSLSMTAGNAVQLTATVSPSDASDKSLKWKSSDPAVAWVDNDGFVEACGKGTAVITVSAANGKQATCRISVSEPAGGDSGRGDDQKPGSGASQPGTGSQAGQEGEKQIPVASISLNSKSAKLNLHEKKTVTLSATVLPENANTGTGLTWTSSNPYSATVTDKGVVTGIESGETTITVMSANGVKASCKVNVVNEAVADGVTFDVSHFMEYSQDSFGRWVWDHDYFNPFVVPNKSVDEDDLTYEINGGKFQYNGDNKAHNVKYENEWEYRYSAMIPDSKNMVASVTYGKNAVYNRYGFKIRAGAKKGRFSIGIKYKGKLLCEREVVISELDDAETELRAFADKVKAGWTSGMTVDDKIGTAQQYIFDNYTYSRVDCVSGADMLGQILRDFGYPIRFAYGEDELKDTPCYSIHPYVHYGHTSVEHFDGENWIRHDAQGHR